MTHRLIEETPDVLNEHEFIFYHFKGCDFIKSNIKHSFFEDCIFEKCNFSLSDLHDTQLRNVHFKKCKFQGINFSVLVTSIGTELIFENCLIDNSSFDHIDITGTQFLECTIRNTNFTHTDLTRCIFTKSDLKNTIFKDCNMKQTDFTQARNFYIDPLQNTFSQTKFSHPEVMYLLDALDIIIE